MRQIKPIRANTKCSSDCRVWQPSSFQDFLVELNHIIKSCDGDDPAPLFRGQINHKWYIDSTFLRNCIKRTFSISDYHQLSKKIRHTDSFHNTMISLLQLKFGTVCKPSQESLGLEKSKNIDPWFELLKNLQQYPEKDKFITGTFLVDWSCSRNIALYFATYIEKGKTRSVSSEDGALWIYDSVATGDTLQIEKLSKTISKMIDNKNILSAKKTLPLIFHPQKQTLQSRSKGQMPIYIAQMDFRYDLTNVWADYEKENKKKVFIKLILNKNLKCDAGKYLLSQGVDENSVYPE